MSGEFLPVTMKECRERGIEQPDFVYVCGDAYVDHSSFGAAIICRLLESRGYSVGMIAQPDWKDPESIQVFGEPRLGYLPEIWILWLIIIQCLKNTGRKMPILPVERWDIDRTGR